MNQQNKVKDNSNNNKNNNNNDKNQSEVLEQGDIYFFYRPKKDAEQVKGIEDVRRFFMVTGPEKSEKDACIYFRNARTTGRSSEGVRYQKGSKLCDFSY